MRSFKRAFVTDVLNRKPLSHWDDIKNQKEFFDNLGKTLGVKTWEDWYHIHKEDIKRNGGTSLITTVHKDSHIRALTTVYNEYPWLLWRFGRVSNDFWTDRKKHKALLEEIAKEIKVHKLEDWYNIRRFEVVNAGGGGLLRYYDGSFIRALMSIYPDHVWKVWLFKEVPRNFWSKTSNLRMVFDLIGKEIGIKTLADWYQIKEKDVQFSKVVTLVNQKYGSWMNGLMSLYPEHDWKPWSFHSVPKNTWDDDENVREAIKDAEKTLHIKKPEDWKEMTSKDLYRAGYRTLVNRFGFPGVLDKLYPQIDWNDTVKSTSSGLSRSHLHLFKILTEEVFPHATDFHLNYLHPNIKSEEGRSFEFDIFVPSFSLAFEYHGEQHFRSHFLGGSSSPRQARDIKKRIACEAAGIILIEVPYWWDYQADSLKATIARSRPDIIDPTSLPYLCHVIPEQAPTQKNGPANSNNGDMKDLALRNVEGEWNDAMSDPGECPWIDGVRAIWNGDAWYISNGQKIDNIPPAFVKGLTELPLDGYMRLEKGTIQDTLNLLSSPSDAKETSDNPLGAWESMKFHVFDAPSLNHKKFESRQEILQDLLSEHPHIVPMKFELVKGRFPEVSREKSSGHDSTSVFIRPASFYHQPDSLFMIKNYNLGLVISSDKESILIRRKDGIEERIQYGNTHEEISLNSVISYRPSSTPGISNLYEIRYDLEWEDIEPILKSSIRYSLDRGTRGRPKCPGCDKVFSDKEEHRIKVGAIIAPKNTLPRHVILNICLNNLCIQKAIQSSIRGRAKIWYPPFDGRISISSDPNALLTQLHENMEGIEFVMEK